MTSPYSGKAAKAIAGMLVADQRKGPEYQKLNDDTLFDSRSGRTIQAGAGYKPLVDPAERAAHGIPPDDKRPYQVGPGNKLINPPAETRVNVDQRQEGAYQVGNAKSFVELNHAIPKAAASSRSKIATLSHLGNLLADPELFTGAGAGLVLDVKRVAKSVGIDVGDLSGAEAVRSIQNQFALELRNPAGGAGMPGAMSDADRAFLQTMPPGLERTKEGNALIGDYMKRVAQRDLDIERLRQRYVKQHGQLNDGFYQAVADYADANPIFTKKDAWPGAAPATGTTKTGVPWKVER
jgi:hypothetical protein